MATKILNVKVGAELGELRREMKKASGIMGNFKSQIQNVGSMVAGAFAFDSIVSFSKEAITLASKIEGVRTAFTKLNNPNLLHGLRMATRGTVTDLELMQSAVRAKNFKIPLEKLATFFEFATARSIETGESVDYLVKSIIDGIGRKSTLVLDNLGISATELQEEIKRTGDFGEAAGNIISRSLEGTGEVADTTATKLARLNTEWTNFKTAVGEGMANIFTAAEMVAGSIGGVGEQLKEAEKILGKAAPKGFFGQQGLTSEQKQFILLAKHFEKTGVMPTPGPNQLDLDLPSFDEDDEDDIVDQIGLIQQLEKQLKDYEKERKEAFSVQAIADYNVKIDELKTKLEELSQKGLNKTPEFSAGAVQGIGAGGGQIGQLMAAQMSMVTTEMMSLEEMSQRIGKVVTDLGPIFQDFAANGIGSLAAAFGEALAGVGNFGDAILATVGGFMQQLGQLMITTGIMTQTFKQILIANPIAAIAAGAALVATGAYFSAKASKMASGMGSSGGGMASSVSSSTSGIRNTQNERINLVIEGKIKGSDIEFALAKSSRIRGITG